MTESKENWRKTREQILIEPSVRYFSANSFGLMSASVYHRVSQLRFELAKNPSNFMLRRVPELLWKSRVDLSKFLAARPGQILFTPNASSALSIITSSLNFPAGGHVLLTEHEYTTAKWNWKRYSDAMGLSLKMLRLPRTIRCAEDIVELACNAMTNKTRVLFFSHVLSNNGTILPAERLCQEATTRGIVSVVDGAQAVGLIDVCLSNIDCDFYIGSGHKWLMMPTGSGFIYLGREKEERLKPLVTSWGYKISDKSQQDLKNQYGSTARLRRLECEGTRDITPWLVASEAIRFRSRLGHADVYRRIKFLACYAKDLLSRNPLLSLVTPEKSNLHAGLIAFSLPGNVDAGELKTQLWENYKIEITTSEYKGHSLLRIATHIHNDRSEIDFLSEALRDVIR